MKAVLSPFCRPLLAVIIAVSFAACSKPPAAEPPLRAVRTVVVQAGVFGAQLEFPGEVKARAESRLGFRVGGKIVERLVDFGASVRPGQVIARLDPRDLADAEAAGKSALAAAAADYKLAEADYRRSVDLQKQNFVSQAEVDRRRSTLDAARAQQERAQAQLRSLGSQTSYAVLTADAAGVVTAIEAEAGQVVAAGQTVVRVARADDKEVWIAVPEDRLDAIRALGKAEVRLWSQQGEALTGRVRDIAAAADPATRTYTVRMKLDNPPADVRLGMTATVRFDMQRPGQMVKLPLSALLDTNGQTSVWVFDEASSTVKPQPVQLGGSEGGEALVGGLAPGQRVVTAGVHVLQAGQKVKLMDAPATAPQAPAEPARTSDTGLPATGARS
ncbi:efflux RND transporter periplasmic adaptor subunit [Derxia gummosa]|uniref:Efflux RND transporter periplasmic adaptor subunit n=1 Tax=Derxia gummosa DSM 723 TaxID=1121388 RepID=A0A8B6X8I6_9BURK|nr:efflux RND transporter periplasmic adaptor subunit [Derxia gummosa]